EWSFLSHPRIILFFFFQAEDGIRDFHVTGVQTCALPISRRARAGTRRSGRAPFLRSSARSSARPRPRARLRPRRRWRPAGRPRQIGRASCRERGEVWGAGGGSKRRGATRERTKTGKSRKA